MTEVIKAVYHPDGTVSVIYPAPNSRQLDEPEDEWLDRVFARTIECGRERGEFEEDCEFERMTKADLPPDRIDRGAWTGKVGKGISIDPVKAKKGRDRAKVNALVENKARRLVIADLIGSGEIPPDYEDEVE